MSSELVRNPPHKPTYNGEPLGHQYSRESVLNLDIVPYRSSLRARETVIALTRLGCVRAHSELKKEETGFIFYALQF